MLVFDCYLCNFFIKHTRHYVKSVYLCPHLNKLSIKHIIIMKKKRTFKFSDYERKALINCVLAVFQAFCDIPDEERTLKQEKYMRCFSRLLSILD